MSVRMQPIWERMFKNAGLPIPMPEPDKKLPDWPWPTTASKTIGITLRDELEKRFYKGQDDVE